MRSGVTCSATTGVGERFVHEAAGGDGVARHRPAPPTRFLRIHQDRGHTVLDLRGEIDILAEVEVVPHLDAATSVPECRVVIDLTRVEFLDASGLRLLYRARQRVLEQHGSLHLVCADALTLRVLRITGLARLLPPRPTLDAVLERP
ncbi:anti-sigma factor antagonist [Streptomyces prasinus]|uniref:anti-sigma factor antagonist n=1 Tax=Streptomyces prasinus TaxID=67345 RepID=UPI0033A13C1C